MPLENLLSVNPVLTDGESFEPGYLVLTKSTIYFWYIRLILSFSFDSSIKVMIQDNGKMIEKITIAIIQCKIIAANENFAM